MTVRFRHIADIDSSNLWLRAVREVNRLAVDAALSPQCHGLVFNLRMLFVADDDLLAE